MKVEVLNGRVSLKDSDKPFVPCMNFAVAFYDLVIASLFKFSDILLYFYLV